jgi:HNH endonuclease
LVDDEISGRPLTADEKSAAAAIRRRIPQAYRAAAPYLLDDLGHYCAYCELPLHDPAQLEHAMPKSQYPTFALDWTNFLPACIGCNSRKNDQPLRSEIGAKLPTEPPPTSSAYFDEVRTRTYRWPDLDDVVGFFGIQLVWRDENDDWHAVPPAASVNAATRQVRPMNVVEGDVRADIPALGLSNAAVAAIVVNEALGGDDRTDEMIRMCGLARTPIPTDSADRRTLFRTETWFRAVRTLAPMATGAVPTTLSPGVVDMIETSGFYWVWLTVAKLISPAVLRLVVAETASTIPGTDASRLP